MDGRPPFCTRASLRCTKLCYCIKVSKEYWAHESLGFNLALQVWRLADGECMGALVGHRGGVMTLASDSPAELVSGASDFTIKVRVDM
jgi:hypothetical protein